MKSVFLVRSPLQLMNAVEAKHYFNLRDEDCIMVIMGDRRNKTKIIRLIKTDPQWGKVVVLTDVNLFRKNPFGCHLINQGEEFPDKKSFLRKSIFNANRLNKISRFLGQVEYIFIGFSRDIYMRHFINSTPHKEVFLLDDGNATIEIAKDRKNKLDTTKKIHGTKKIKFYAKKYLLGLKYDEVDSLTFFSAYDVDLSDTDSLVKNDYSYIRKKSRDTGIDDSVYFVGAPLDDAGIVSHDQHMFYLKKVRSYFSDKKIVYVAHHRENKNNLDYLRDKLKYDVIQFEFPFEYQISIIGPRPSVVASFFSSALDNCRLIFDDEIKIVSFRINLEKCPIKDEIESIYDYYKSKENECFQVVSLKAD